MKLELLIFCFCLTGKLSFTFSQDCVDGFACIGVSMVRHSTEIAIAYDTDETDFVQKVPDSFNNNVYINSVFNQKP